jgi:hypothetical protein
MDYQNRPTPLAGYRDLTEDEVNLVNQIKVAEAEIGALWGVVLSCDADKRMAAIAKTNFQDAFMWLVRSVTKPRDVFESSEF